MEFIKLYNKYVAISTFENKINQLYFEKQLLSKRNV